MSDRKMTPESIPLLCEGVDMLSLQVDAQEGFIISRLDGRTSVEHIISMSGLGRTTTVEILERLLGKGVICLHESRKAEGRQEEPKKEEKPKKAERERGKKRRFDQIPEGEAFFNWIDRLHQELDNIDYFELLGVDSKATTKEIKKAYFRRSKIFHPDRYYRKAERDALHKLQDIFKLTNTAFKVLSKEEKRKEYENELKGKDKRVKLSTLTVAAKIEEEELKKKRPDLPKFSLDFSNDKKRKKEEQILKKLKGSGFAEQIEKAKRFYDGAVLELRKKNFNSARTNIKLALQYEPMNQKYKDELERIDEVEKEMQVEISFEEGLAAEESKDYDLAIRHFHVAVRHNSQNPDYLYKLAEAVLKYQNNFERARSLCLKAIELREGDPKIHFVLGQAYKGLGQKRPAQLQFKKVLDLEPKNKQASKELKALKKS